MVIVGGEQRKAAEVTDEEIRALLTPVYPRRDDKKRRRKRGVQYSGYPQEQSLRSLHPVFRMGLLELGHAFGANLSALILGSRP